MFPSESNTNHPTWTNRVQRILAKNNWLKLFAYFFFALVLISIVFGTLQDFLEHKLSLFNLSYDNNSFSSFLAICDIKSLPDDFSKIIRALIGIIKIVLPALFLGAVVYKISIPDNVYEARSKLSIQQCNKRECEENESEKAKYAIYFRSYNASGLMAVSLNFSCYIRQAACSPDGKNYKINNIELLTETAREYNETDKEGKETDKKYNSTEEITSANPPVMYSHVPHSVIIELDELDLKYDEKGKPIELLTIKGNNFFPQNKKDGKKHPGESFLLVVIKGWLPPLGSEFTEMQYYRITGDNPDYDFGDFQHIDVEPPKNRKELSDDKPDRWDGWDNFDGIEKS